MSEGFVQAIKEDTLTLRTRVIHIDGQKGDLKEGAIFEIGHNPGL